MHDHRFEKVRDLAVPVIFAVLWGLFAIWLRAGRSVL
jgi:hypothetical protein